jgi:hypothetical protein
MKYKTRAVGIGLVIAAMSPLSGCAQPLNPREEAALVGGGIGLASGALVGSATGYPETGALIGAPLGMLAGALIGDELMERDRRDYYQNRELARLRREVARLRWENERRRGW